MSKKEKRNRKESYPFFKQQVENFMEARIDDPRLRELNDYVESYLNSYSRIKEFSFLMIAVSLAIITLLASDYYLEIVQFDETLTTILAFGSALSLFLASKGYMRLQNFEDSTGELAENKKSIEKTLKKLGFPDYSDLDHHMILILHQVYQERKAIIERTVLESEAIQLLENDKGFNLGPDGELPENFHDQARRLKS